MEWIRFTKKLPQTFLANGGRISLGKSLLDSWQRHFESKGISCRRRKAGKKEWLEILCEEGDVQ